MQQFPNSIKMFLYICWLFWVACNDNTHEHQSGEVVEAEKTYTCPMHPQVVQHRPGLCPVCNMDLVPFDKNNQDPFLTLSQSQQKLANITIQQIGDSAASSSSIRLNGKLVNNPMQTKLVSSRVAGRIEQLWFKETGVPVKKGQPLYRIYSETLAGLQQEFVLNRAQANSFPDNEKFKQLEQSSRQKLTLYGLTNSQIDHLSAEQKNHTQVFYAPQDGVIGELMVSEGGYVEEGGIVMQLESFEHVWVEANLYPSEANTIKEGDKVTVSIAGSEQRPQTMTVDFMSPALRTGSQLQTIRGILHNTANWPVGQQVVVTLPKKSSGNSNSILLPLDAVIRDGKGAHVWISDGAEKFEPRKVSTGTETEKNIVIEHGIQPGENVVVTGVYLLYSEYILKKGIDPSHH